MPRQRHRGRFFAVLLAAPLALLWSGGATAADAARSPDDVLVALLNDCAARLDRDRDIGYGRVALRCPGLAPVITGSDRAAWLPSSWQERSNELSAGGLRELARLVREESMRSVTSSGPTAESLATVLRQVSANPDDDSGLWARTMSWIRALLARQRAGAAEEDFGIADWLRSRGVGASAWAVLTYALFSVLIGIAIFVIATELRAAGVLRRTARGANRESRSPRASVPLRLEDLASLPLLERPALLLRLILEALSAAGRMRGHTSGHASRTRNEILRDVRLDRAAQRDSLAALARRTEQLRYAAVPPAPPEIEASVADGSTLLRELIAAPERTP
jgi:hypothetical protein